MYIGKSRIIEHTRREYGRDGQVAEKTFKYAYALRQGKNLQTDVTEPGGQLRRVTFSPNGYIASETYPVGARDEVSIRFERQADSSKIFRVRVTCISDGQPFTASMPVEDGRHAAEVLSELQAACRSAR